MGNWVFSADLLYGTVGGLSAFADIRMIGYFLYNHMFMQLLVLGYIFLIVILGVIPLLLNRNLRVKRQEVYEQQKNEMINHLILFY